MILGGIKMVIVNCPLMQNDVIKVVEGISLNNANPFKFVEKKGIKILFATADVNIDEACTIIKSEMRKAPFGSVLNFNVIPA